MHPEFESIKYIINDFTEVTKLAINTDHTKIYATTDDIISDTKGNLKIAIVAKQDAHIALANNYREEMKNKLFECEIFQTVEEAQNGQNHKIVIKNTFYLKLVGVFFRAFLSIDISDMPIPV